MYCVGRDSVEGHYECDGDGNRVCLEGYQNTSSDCTQCVPSLACCKTLIQLIIHYIDSSQLNWIKFMSYIFAFSVDLWKPVCSWIRGILIEGIHTINISRRASCFTFPLHYIAPVGGYCSLPGNCVCLPGFTGGNCTEGQSLSNIYMHNNNENQYAVRVC